MHILNKTHYTIINTLPQVSAATAPSSGRNSVVCSKQYYNIWLQILRYVIHGFTILKYIFLYDVFIFGNKLYDFVIVVIAKDVFVVSDI